MNVELGTSRVAICGTSGNQLHISSSFTIVKQHPQEINLGKVDQVWFLDFVLLRGAEVREAAPTLCADDEGDEF